MSSELTVGRNAQFQAPVGELHGDTALPVGLRVAQIPQFGFVLHGVAVLVEYFARDVLHRAVGHDAGRTFGNPLESRAVEGPQRPARPGDDLRRGDLADDPLVDPFGQFEHLVAVAGVNHVDVPAKFLRADRCAAESYLDALVHEFAGVDERILRTRDGIDRSVEDLVTARGVVIGEIHAEAPLEETGLQTGLPTFNHFGFEVGVDDAGRIDQAAAERAVRVVIVDLVGIGVVADVGP